MRVGRLIEPSLFIAANLSASLLAWLFVVLPRPKDFQNTLPLNLLLEPSEGLFQWFIFSNKDFRHSGLIIRFIPLKSIVIRATDSLLRACGALLDPPRGVQYSKAHEIRNRTFSLR